MRSIAWEQLHHETLLKALSGDVEGSCDMCLSKKGKKNSLDWRISLLVSPIW